MPATLVYAVETVSGVAPLSGRAALHGAALRKAVLRRRRQEGLRCADSFCWTCLRRCCVIMMLGTFALLDLQGMAERTTQQGQQALIFVGLGACDHACPAELM
eukprot:1480410-Heterocapsa_arctica.AAC.1